MTTLSTSLESKITQATTDLEAKIAALPKWSDWTELTVTDGLSGSYTIPNVLQTLSTGDIYEFVISYDNSMIYMPVSLPFTGNEDESILLNSIISRTNIFFLSGYNYKNADILTIYLTTYTGTDANFSKKPGAFYRVFR